MQIISVLLLVVCSLSGGAYAQDAEIKLRPLYDGHRWFQLRDEVMREGAPFFYKAAVEIAFNQPEAEKDLQAAIPLQHDAERVFDARELLLGLYFRSGRYRDALALANLMRKQKPDAVDIINILPTLSALSAYPNQRAVSRKSSRSRMEIEDENLILPVRINGVAAHYIVDNGFSLSGMSEAEAGRLKLTIHDATTKTDTISGAEIKFRIAIADDLKVGGLHLKHVAFYIVPDSQPPFNTLRRGRQGILGIPVILSMSRFQWSPKKHTFTLLPLAKSFNQARSNLSFVNGTSIFSQVGFEGKMLDFSLDMGAQETVLYRTFAKAFPSFQESGTPESHRLTGVGGSTEIESVFLPSLSFTIGRRTVLLEPAHMLLKENNSSSSWFAGNLGMDLLNEAGAVEIDFNSMTLSLR